MDGNAAEMVRDSFVQRVHPDADPRLTAFLAAFIGQAGDLITRFDARRSDLQAVIRFLTAVGEACDEKRQEWVLLFDTLGLTTAIETNSARRPAGTTPNTLLGPFFREGAPERQSGETICIDGVGAPMLFRAQVTDLDDLPVPGARVDVWQANGQGLFENQVPDQQPEFNLRGTYRTGPDGTVDIRTVRPGGTHLPSDGPVADLVRKLGLSLRRPAHMQFRIRAAGFKTLTTHVFDQSDPHIGDDPLFCVHSDLLADFGAAHPAGGTVAAYRFVLARSRPGEEDL